MTIPVKTYIHTFITSKPKYCHGWNHTNFSVASFTIITQWHLLFGTNQSFLMVESIFFFQNFLSLIKFKKSILDILNINSFIFFLTAKSCTIPSIPENGERIGDNFNAYATVTFRCNPGFDLQPADSQQIICLPNTRWNKPSPICQRKLLNNIKDELFI